MCGFGTDYSSRHVLAKTGWQEVEAPKEIQARSRVWPWRRTGLCGVSEEVPW